MATPHPSFERLLHCARAATVNRAPEQRVVDEADLQRVLAWSPQNRTNYKSRGVSKLAALAAEHQLGCPATYVLGGTNPPNWMNPQRLVTGELPAGHSVAQDLSQSPFEAVPLLDREQLLTNKTPELFRFALLDDAMAPEMPAGTEIVWTTRRRVAPGRLILLKDSHDQLHVRQCHQGQGPASWIATPNNPAYRSFTSSDGDVSVLAVFKGRLEPDDA